MAKITMGGQEYTIPELNFMALERAWPFVQTAMVSDNSDPMKGPLAAMRIIAAGIMEDENFQPDRYGVTATPDQEDLVHEQVVRFFRKRLKANEIGKLTECIYTILEEAGLVAAEGEDTLPPVVEDRNPSPETAPDLSPSS